MSASRDPKWWISIREVPEGDLAALTSYEQFCRLGLKDGVDAARYEVDQVL